MDQSISLRCPLKTETDIEVPVEKLTKIIQEATWATTPTLEKKQIQEEVPLTTRQTIAEKRLKKQWQLERNVDHKRKFKKITKELKDMFLAEKNRKVTK